MSGGALIENVRPDPQGFQRPRRAKKSEPFRVEILRDGATTAFVPVGELDLNTIDQLDGALRQALDDGCRDQVLDLRGLSFMDSTGIHLVMRWNGLAKERGVKFAVVQGGDRIRRLFEIVGLLDQLPFIDSESSDLSPQETQASVTSRLDL